MLKCIAASENILFYLNETPDINTQIKEKMLGGITKDITKEYFPCIFILPKSEPLGMSSIVITPQIPHWLLPIGITFPLPFKQLQVANASESIS